MTDLNQVRRSRWPLIIALLLILAVVIGFHLLMPLFGVTLAITGAMWGILVASVTIFCVLILLFFLFSGGAIIALGCFGFIWVIIALILFPILFPLLVPLFIIMCLVGLLRK